MPFDLNKALAFADAEAPMPSVVKTPLTTPPASSPAPQPSPLDKALALADAAAPPPARQEGGSQTVEAQVRRREGITTPLAPATQTWSEAAPGIWQSAKAVGLKSVAVMADIGANLPEMGMESPESQALNQRSIEAGYKRAEDQAAIAERAKQGMSTGQQIVSGVADTAMDLGIKGPAYAVAGMATAPLAAPALKWANKLPWYARIPAKVAIESPKMSAEMAAVGAAANPQHPLAGAAEGAVSGGELGAIGPVVEPAARLLKPVLGSRLAQGVAEGSGFAGLAAAQGGGPAEIASQGVVGGAFGFKRGVSPVEPRATGSEDVRGTIPPVEGSAPVVSTSPLVRPQRQQVGLPAEARPSALAYNPDVMQRGTSMPDLRERIRVPSEQVEAPPLVKPRERIAAPVIEEPRPSVLAQPPVRPPAPAPEPVPSPVRPVLPPADAGGTSALPRDRASLQKMTMAQLGQMARDAGIKPAKLTKTGLVDALAQEPLKGDQNVEPARNPNQGRPVASGENVGTPGGVLAPGVEPVVEGKGKGTEPKPGDVGGVNQSPREFSSTQVNLPPNEAETVKSLGKKLIPDSALAADGREEVPHVTVKYGLHTADPEEVSRLLQDEGPIKVRLGKVSIFPAGKDGEADVVKVDVDSPDLHRLNKKISDNVKVTDTHPTYKPHVTLAYVKPGESKKYIGNTDLEGKEITLNSVFFSGKNHNDVEIPLKGEPDNANSQPASKAPDANEPVAGGAQGAENVQQNAGGPEGSPRVPERGQGEGKEKGEEVVIRPNESEVMPNGQKEGQGQGQGFLTPGAEPQGEAQKAPEAAKGKDAWEMTRSEYYKSFPLNKPGEIIKKQGLRIAIKYEGNIYTAKKNETHAHIVIRENLPYKSVETGFVSKDGDFYPQVPEDPRPIVEKAVQANKPVPRAVLEEYANEPWAKAALEKMGKTDEAAPAATEVKGESAAEAKLGKSDAPKDVPDMFSADAARERITARNEARAKGGSGTESLMMFHHGQAVNNAPLIPQGEQKPVTAREIIERASSDFGVPIRGKGTYRMGQRVGFFKPRESVIRLKEQNDIKTNAHEIAHKLERTLWGPIVQGRRHFAPFRQELANLDYDQTPNGRRTHEGWAEYLYHYLVEGDNATVAPSFDHWLWNDFLPQKPEIKAKLEAMHALYQRWLNQGAEARILSQIDRTGGEKMVQPSIFDRMNRGLLRLRTWFDNSTAPLSTMLKQSEVDMSQLRPSEDPVKLITALKQKSPAMARMLVMEGPRDPDTGALTGPGLKRIMQPIASMGKKSIDKFMAYAYARRAMDLYPRDINPGILKRDAEHMVQKIEAAHPEWKDVSDQITAWNDNLLKILVDAGGLSEPVAQAIRDANPVYIPLKRVFVDELGIKPSGKRGFVNLPQAIKKIRGSGRAIHDPLESMVEYAGQIISLANKIRVAKSMADLADRFPNLGAFIEKVPAPMEAQKVRTKDVIDMLNNAGAIPNGPNGRPIQIDTSNLGDLMTFFSQGTNYRGKDNIVSIWREGKREFYELHPDLYRAMTDMDTPQLHWTMNLIFGAPARLIRLGATGLKPAFAIANYIRDSFTYQMQSQKRSAMLTDTLGGLASRLTRDKWFTLYRSLGGEMSGFTGNDRKMLREARGELLASTAPRKAVFLLAHPIDTLRSAIGITESASRIPEFKRAYKKAMAQYGSHRDAAIEAMNAAQDVTINFTRSGSLGKYINQVIPFWNAAVQSIGKAGRTTIEHPIQTTLRGVATMTLPTIGLWMINRDKDWYREMPAWEKASYWHVEMGQEKDGRPLVWRIPKPFEWGSIFAGTPEAFLDSHYAQDPTLFKDAGKAMLDNLTPNMLPAIIQTAWEVGSNKNFAGQPIVPQSMQDLPPEQQYQKYTPEIYKTLGKLMGYSPLKLKHLAEGYSGGLARSLTSSATAAQGALSGAKSVETSDLPVIGRFVLRNPDFPARSVERFYQRLNELDLKDKRDTISNQELAELVLLQASAKDLSDIRKAIAGSNDDVEKDQLERVMTLRLQSMLGRKPTAEDILSATSEREIKAKETTEKLERLGEISSRRSLADRRIRQKFEEAGRKKLTLRQRVIDESIAKE